jgi:hypothetical protein
MVKVKKFLYRPGRALKILDVEFPDLRTKVVSTTDRPPAPSGNVSGNYFS